MFSALKIYLFSDLAAAGSNVSKEERKIHGEDLGGASAHEEQD